MKNNKIEVSSYHHNNLRNTLLDKAEQDLQKNGLDSLSLRNLAREVGVSHAAPQRHFANKQELLNALAERGFTKLKKLLQETIDSSWDNYRHCLYASLRTFAIFATQNHDLFLLMNSIKHDSASINFQETASKAYDPIRNLIQEGQDLKIFKSGKIEDIGIILFATLLGIITMINNDNIKIEELDKLLTITLQQFLNESEI